MTSFMPTATLLKRDSFAYDASNFDQAIEHSRAALILIGGLRQTFRSAEPVRAVLEMN
jgi:hypothetical protein